uniref:C-type lectin domain-containing protein n=1 Tax=Branchiostoma floridae TaxID=7739 RepID=C3ZSY0_BRAFL|eukprot:XP_002588314.1 hypothetical protein BRAFLDRAFT_81457 [Branchiostoma floridae]
MQEDQQQSQTDDTGTTPTQQPQTDWRSIADAAASIPNALYVTRAGTIPTTQQPQTDWTSMADAAASIPNALYVTRADRTYTGEASRRRALCDFIRSYRIRAGIVVLLTLVVLGFAPLTATKTTCADCPPPLKRDLDKERNRTAALEQRLDEISNTQGSSLQGYAVFRGTFYRAFNTPKTFSEASAICSRRDGGSLAIPRDAETNAFLISLRNSGPSAWFGLHDQREEGSFEWVDGSALGAYNSWARGQPDNRESNQDCVYYSASPKDKWAVSSCNLPKRFICQSSPGTSL